MKNVFTQLRNDEALCSSTSFGHPSDAPEQFFADFDKFRSRVETSSKAIVSVILRYEYGVKVRMSTKKENVCFDQPRYIVTLKDCHIEVYVDETLFSEMHNRSVTFSWANRLRPMNFYTIFGEMRFAQPRDW